MRTPWLVGHIPPRRMARICAWCRCWLDAESERLHAAGATLTHGICDDCMRKEMAA